MYLSLNLILIISTLGYLVFGSETDPLLSKIENIKIWGKSLPRPEKVNLLASQMLDDTFDHRHKNLLDSIDNFDNDKLQTMKDKMIKEKTKELNELELKFGNKPNKPKKQFNQLQSDLKNIKDFSITEYKTNVRDQIMGEKGMDTISVRLDGKNNVFVAGNVKTRKLPMELDNPELFNTLLKDRTRGAQGLRNRADRKIPFEYQDFGIQNSDAFGIQKTLDRPLAKDLGIGKETKVFGMKPVYNPIVEGEMIAQINAEKTNLETKMSSKLEELERRPTTSTNNEDLGLERNKIEIDYKSKMVELDIKLESQRNTIYHAETLHTQQDKKLGLNDKSVLGVSKSLCDFCEEHVKKHGLFEYVQQGPGMPANKVQNWAPPVGVELSGLESMKKAAMFEDVVDAPKKSRTSSIASTSSCSSSSRRRRSASKPSCIFIYKDDTQKRCHTCVDEINSKAFLDEYTKSPPDVKADLTRFAESSNGKLIGDVGEVGKVSKMMDHEKMKKHVDKSSKVQDSLNTGDFDGDSLKGTSISPTKTRIKLSKGVNKFLKKAGKVSGTLGKFLLAKGLVQGIANGDTTGLAIMGGRILGEAGLEFIAKHGAKIAGKIVAKAGVKLGIKATAKLASKGFKVLGKAAGPIGAVVDIGMSIWGLTKAIQRLNDPNSNKFEQNEAIADIVAESLDIAITAITTIASLAFPPLAPLFAVIGFFASLFITAAVSIYKAQNHVDCLQSKLPLLDYERDAEFGRHLIGQETSEYILNLIKTKDANNLAVNASINLLEQRPEMIGHVFPSRSIELEGGCRLLRAHCAVEIIGCWQWEDYKVLSDNCYKGDECLDSGWTCENRDKVAVPSSDAGYDKYKCDCKGKEQTRFGYPKLNSVVDFRQKQLSYLDRSVPDPPYHYSYEMLCIPSSIVSKGDRISQRNPVHAYTCENAIGIKRKSGEGKYMLYDMGEGNDKVYLDPNSTTDSRFHVEDGTKEFYAGKGSDIFAVLGPCSYLRGTLDGEGGEKNALAVGESCAAGEKLEIDLDKSLMSTLSNKVKIKVHNLTQIYGRSNEGDSIRASCTTEYIAGGGGKNQLWDTISTPTTTECQNNLTIIADPYTSVWAGLSQTNSLVYIPQGYGPVNVSFSQFTNMTGKTTVYIQHYAANLTRATITQESIFNIEFIDGKSVNFNGSSGKFVDILLNELQGSPSAVLNNDQGISCYHRLEGGPNLTRNGSPGVSNVFNFLTDSWKAYGGNEDDTFLLSGDGTSLTNINSSFISGGGGIDGVYLADSLNESEFFMDFREQLIKGVGSGWINLDQVEAFHGRLDKREVVTCFCDTSLVKGNGGLSRVLPDLITIPNITCPVNTTFTIITAGFTSIKSHNLDGKLQVFVTGNNPSEIEMDLSLYENKESHIQFQFPISFLNNFSYDKETAFKLEANNNTTVFNMTLQYNIPTDTDYIPNLVVNFLEEYGPPSSLYIPKMAEGFLAFHNIPEGHSARKRNGSMSISNYFRIGQNNNWEIIGGGKNDVFEILGTFSGNIFGGEPETVNDLRISSKGSGNIVNLLDGILMMTDGLPGNVSRIHRVFGLENSGEKVVVGCDTKLVTLEGGSSDVMDFIEFPDNLRHCPNISTQIVAKGYTTLKGSNYSFITLVQGSVTNNELYFEAVYKIDKTSRKTFMLNFSPADLKSFDAKVDADQTDYKIRVTFGQNQEMHLNFQTNNEDHGQYIGNQEFMFMQGVGKSVILIQKSNGFPLVFHELKDDDLININTEEVLGATGASNYFNVQSSTNLNLIGGLKDDTFHVKNYNFTGKITGGLGLNTLTLNDNDFSGPLAIDLRNGTLTGGVGNVTLLKDIQRLSGRVGKQERIIVGCDSKFINSEGGSSQKSQDYIDIPANLVECFEAPDLTLFIHPYTIVKNSMKSGFFRYIVQKENDFEIHTFPGGKAHHEYRFEFGLSSIKSAAFDTSSFYLSIQLKSARKLTFYISQQEEKISQISTQLIFTQGGIRTDFHVLQATGQILASTKIQNGTASRNIQGVLGPTNNDFEVDISPTGVTGQIKGAELEDTFRLISAKFIASLDGSGSVGNSLEIYSSFWTGHNLTLDLRDNSTGSLKNGRNVTIIQEIKQIQILQGRKKVDESDTVIIGCDTNFVSEFEQIFITQAECLNQRNLIIELDDLTQVTFKLPDEQRIFKVFRNATFHYRFKSLRSFNVNMAYWLDIRQTQQIYHLAFELKALESIFFKDAAIFYTIEGTTYTHSIDTFLAYDQEFYAQPKFLTEDGYQIKISRTGEIVLIGSGSSSWLSYEDDIILSRYSELAEKLGATFIIQGADTFLYIGHKNTQNVLTNTDQRSLLYGGGGNSTNYVIMDLIQDVKIYPGFAFHDYQDDSEDEKKEIHLLDLTEILYEIRGDSLKDKKYVPFVKEMENGDLEIIMEGFINRFPGKIILINGATYASQIHVILDATVMKIVGSKLEKRETFTNTLRRWRLEPFPLILTEGQITIMTLEDFELGQEIILESPNSDDAGLERLNISEYLNAYRNGTDLVMSNIGSEINQTNRQLLTTFTLMDAYSIEEDGVIVLDKLSARGIHLSDGTIYREDDELLDGGGGGSSSSGGGSDLWRMAESAISDEKLDWEDTLEERENILLEDLPDVPKSFNIPFFKKMWKKERNWSIFIIILIFLSWFLLLLWCLQYFCSKLKCILVATVKEEGLKVEVKEKKINEESCLTPIDPDSYLEGKWPSLIFDEKFDNLDLKSCKKLTYV